MEQNQQEHVVLIHAEHNYMNETIVAEYDKKFWSYDQTLALINIVESRYDELHHPRKRKHVWQNVSTDLESVNIFATANICQKKWQNLLRSYKTCKENKNKSGRGPMRFQYYEKIDELMGDEPHINSAHSLSVINIDSPASTNSEMSLKENRLECSERVRTISGTSNSSEYSERVRTVSGASSSNTGSEEQSDSLPPTPLPTTTPTKGKKRKNIQMEYINLKKQLLETKEADWRNRMEEKEKRKEKRELKKLELYERKLEERKVKAIEELIKFKKNM